MSLVLIADVLLMACFKIFFTANDQLRFVIYERERERERRWVLSLEIEPSNVIEPIISIS